MVLGLNPESKPSKVVDATSLPFLYPFTVFVKEELSPQFK